MPLDPQVAEFYKNKHSKAVFGKIEIKKIRAAIDMFYNARECLVDLPRVDNKCIPSDGEQLPIRIYYPEERVKIGEEGLPVMIFFHGGAFVVHNVNSHDNLCRKLSKECNVIVVSVEYRLAPEKRHPAQVIDAVSTLEWLIDHHREIGANPEKIIPAGDSAGATLAMDICIYAKNHGIKIPLAILYYGYFGCGDVRENESYKLYSNGKYGVSTDLIDASSDMVKPVDGNLSANRDNRYPELNSLNYLNPGNFEDSELRMDTKSLIVVAEYDPLKDDGLKFAEKMKAVGNDVELINMSGMTHGFMVLWNKFDRCSRVFEATCKAIEDILPSRKK